MIVRDAYFKSYCIIRAYSYALRRHLIYEIPKCFRNLTFDAIHMISEICPRPPWAIICTFPCLWIASRGRTDHSWVPNDLREPKSLLQMETAGRAVRTGLVERADLQWVELSAASASGANCLPQW